MITSGTSASCSCRSWAKYWALLTSALLPWPAPSQNSGSRAPGARVHLVEWRVLSPECAVPAEWIHRFEGIAELVLHRGVVAAQRGRIAVPVAVPQRHVGGAETPLGVAG